MSYSVEVFLQQAEKELMAQADFYHMYCHSFIEEIEMYNYCLITYSDCRARSFFPLARKKISRFILDIITLYTQNSEMLNANQEYEPKPFQIIRDYNGVQKVIAKKKPPSKGGSRDRRNFKSYTMKLHNSISRSKQTVHELAKCNDWQYFVTFTINKERYDRYDLEKYITAFKKWLSNYPRKTGGRKIDYILIPELGLKGAWHVHGLMNGVPPEHLSLFERGNHPIRLVNSNYLNWEVYEKKFGYCSFSKIRSREKVAGYITKHIRKSSATQERALHSRLYYASKGLNRSTEICRGYNLVYIDKYDFENEWAGIKWL